MRFSTHPFIDFIMNRLPQFFFYLRLVLWLLFIASSFTRVINYPFLFTLDIVCDCYFVCLIVTVQMLFWDLPLIIQFLCHSLTMGIFLRRTRLCLILVASIPDIDLLNLGQLQSSELVDDLLSAGVLYSLIERRQWVVLHCLAHFFQPGTCNSAFLLLLFQLHRHLLYPLDHAFDLLLVLQLQPLVLLGFVLFRLF